MSSIYRIAGTSKTSTRQFEIMLEFMETHPNLFTGKLSQQYTAKERRKEWEELTNLLNANSCGPRKNSHKWRKTWTDWKFYVKAKASRIKMRQAKAGGNTSLPEVLSPLEQKLVDMSSSIWEEGDPMMIVENDEGGITTYPQVEIFEDSGNVSLSTANEMLGEGVSNNQVYSGNDNTSVMGHRARKARITNAAPAVGRKRCREVDMDSCEKLTSLLSSAHEQTADSVKSISMSLDKIAKIEEQKATALDKIAQAEERKAAAHEKIAEALASYFKW